MTTENNRLFETSIREVDQNAPFEIRHKDLRGNTKATKARTDRENKLAPTRHALRWTKEEHELFLEGLEKYGRGDWKSISRNFVKTKTHIQIGSHAQKYFKNLAHHQCKHPGLSISDVHIVDKSDKNPIMSKSPENCLPSLLSPSFSFIANNLNENNCPISVPSTPVFSKPIDSIPMQKVSLVNMQQHSNLFSPHDIHNSIIHTNQIPLEMSMVSDPPTREHVHVPQHLSTQFLNYGSRPLTSSATTTQLSPPPGLYFHGETTQDGSPLEFNVEDFDSMVNSFDSSPPTTSFPPNLNYYRAVMHENLSPITGNIGKGIGEFTSNLDDFNFPLTRNHVSPCLHYHNIFMQERNLPPLDKEVTSMNYYPGFPPTSSLSLSNNGTHLITQSPLLSTPNTYIGVVHEGASSTVDNCALEMAEFMLADSGEEKHEGSESTFNDDEIEAFSLQLRKELEKNSD